MERDAAMEELEFVRQVLDRTHHRVDFHGFHFVHWGALVLVWYPVGNLIQNAGETGWFVGWNLGCFALGMILSFVREAMLGKRPRIEGDNTFVTRQVGCIVGACIGAGVVLSMAAPAGHWIDGRTVPVIWGFVYAVMAFMVGVVYEREFMKWGTAIFVAAVVSMFFPDWCAMIVGPVMGVGILFPGLAAERRVAAMRSEISAAADAV